MTDRTELVQNAARRMVPTMVNGKPQIPYLGVAKYQPRGRKAAPPVRSSKDYPDNGDKRVPDLDTALRKCGPGQAGLYRNSDSERAEPAAPLVHAVLRTDTGHPTRTL